MSVSAIETISPFDIINTLLGFETDENNNLIQILGIIRPKKSSETSITSLIRGLFTKNNNLLKLLHQHRKIFESSVNNNDDKQTFKSFINDFILWTEDDILLLFDKYKGCLESGDYNDTHFAKPIMHLTNYISFIESTLFIIRNPYVLDQLDTFKNGCVDIIENYMTFIENSTLNNISFDKVQLFGETNHIRNFSDNVCSYFKITQIVERSRSARLTIDNSKQNTHVEFLLLNLNGVASQVYNALAIVSVPKDDSSRFLMFPPFRVNELSVSYSNSKQQLILRAIHFGYNKANVNETLVINYFDEDFLADWVKKLSVIFPLEDPDSPLDENFLIKLSESDNDLKMSGLGIELSDKNLDDDVDSGSVKLESTLKFKDLMPSPGSESEFSFIPSINQLQSPQSGISNHSHSSDMVEETVQALTQLGVPHLDKSSLSIPSPVSSFISRESLDSTGKSIANANLKVQTVPSGVSVKHAVEDRPISSSAAVEDIDDEDKENIVPNTTTPNYKSKNSSVPNLSISNSTTQHKSIYKLSTGSEINISNFGHSHNPSFSIHSNLNELVTKERPTSKIFGLFKKKGGDPVKPSNPKGLTIGTQMPMNSDETLPLSASSLTSNESTISNTTTSFTQQKNTSGSAFALPSSTSTYFFKPYAKQNVNSSTDNGEIDLKIPQSLKDTINDENTVDFYISPTSKKSMKVSKWKAKYGKWEMLTVSEKVFIKLVVNYQLRCAWLLVFKEEYDSEFNEEIDKPVLIIDINHETDITQSSALDIQIASRNSVNNEAILIMIRSFSYELTQAIGSNIKNVKGAIQPNRLLHKSSHSSLGNSRQTMMSSVMDLNSTSKSSTSTSISSIGQSKSIVPESQLSRDVSLLSINSEDINNATILNNPENTKLLLLNNMTIRLQKRVENGDNVTSPSSWKILSMYSLSIYIISDHFSGKNYFNFSMKNNNPDNNEKDHNWLICEEDKFDRIERIGKAGLMIDVSEDNLFMIECKGKREFKELYEVF